MAERLLREATDPERKAEWSEWNAVGNPGSDKGPGALRERMVVMVQNRALAVQRAMEFGQWWGGWSSGLEDEHALRKIRTTMVNAAVEVGALIDAACCRYGDWIDWEHYRPHGAVSGVAEEDSGSIVRLALPENYCGLRAGGYIEMCLSKKNRVVAANGGYYDPDHRPRTVIDGYLPWHELDPQKLGQVILEMFDRITREYSAKEGSEGKWAPSSGRSERRPGADGGPGAETSALPGRWWIVEQSA